MTQPPPPDLPVLYSFRRCPYAMRARLALLASGTACELREVVLARKPAALLDASPKGTVPVLCLPGGRVLDESLDIMRWALQRHDPRGWLAPPLHGQGAECGDGDALVAANDGSFKRHLDRYKYPGRYDRDGAVADPLAHRAAGAVFLASLDARLAATGGLCGPHPALADAAIAPFVRQFAAVDRGWFAAQPWPRLQGWLAAFAASPLLAQAMVRHPPWTPGDPGVRFPAQDGACGWAWTGDSMEKGR